MKRLIALLLAVLLIAALFAGCAGSGSGRKSGKKDKDDEETASVEGTYDLKYINDVSPLEYFKSLYEEYGVSFEDLGIDESAFEELMILEIKSGGTFVMSSKMDDPDEPEKTEGKWVLDGDVLTLSVEGEDETVELKWSGNKLLMTEGEGEDAETLTFVRR